MDPDRLNTQWKLLILVDARNQQIPLKSFIKASLGRHKGGVLFVGCGKEDGENLVLKSDSENNCYRKVDDTGDDDRDWEWMGYLVDNSRGPDLPPYV